MSVPNWPRYQEGELAGFLHAPGEQLVRKVPEVVVRRARGRIASPTSEELHDLPLQYLQPTPGDRTPGPGIRPPDFVVIDTKMFVVELRGPDPSAAVRTVVTRSGMFDFGPLPNGSYAMKATASGRAFAPGWRSQFRTVVVSDSADPATEIVVR